MGHITEFYYFILNNDKLSFHVRNESEGGQGILLTYLIRIACLKFIYS